MLTRGPLPTSVYWRRRLVALTIAAVLVVVIAKLLGHGSGGSSAVQVAATGQASTAPTTTSSSPVSTTPTPSTTATPYSSTEPSPTAPISTGPTTGAVSAPGGQCQPADVVVTPSVTGAVVGEPVTIDLAVQTRTEPACTWTVSPSTLQVKVTSQGSPVWSTVDCHHAIHGQQLTLSDTGPTQTSLTWGGHTSDAMCSSHSPWAGEGTYTVTAVALGGQPASATFTLGGPTVIVTVTPTPSAAGSSPSATSSRKPSSSATSSSSRTSSPSGTSSSAPRHRLPPG